MDRQVLKSLQQRRRAYHVRKKIVGTPQRPRLSVFRSNKHIFAQLVDDLAGSTLVATGSLGKSAGVANGGNRTAASAVGKKLAELAKAKGIVQVAFDRGHYRFHGRVKALADGARAGGLKF